MKPRNLFILQAALAVLGAIALAVLATRRPDFGAALLRSGPWAR